METIPQDLEAEKAIIGICMGAGTEAIEEVRLHTPTEGLFSDIRYAEVFRRFEKIASSGKPITFEAVSKVTISHDLPLDFIFGLDSEWLPFSALLSYLPAAIEARKRREAIYAAHDLISNAQDLSRPVDTAIDQAEQALFATRFKTDPDGSIKESLAEAVSDWELAHQSQGKHTGVDSGFLDLDHLTWGFQPRNLIVIAARPSQGKTALLCNIAEHACILGKVPTLVFSLEMTRKELLKRMVCSMARVSSSDMRSGQWCERTFPKVSAQLGKINSAPLTIVDKGSLSVNAMRSIARRHVAKKGIKLILVDYLQKVRSSGKHEKRTYEVGEVSAGLKEMAKECGCPVVTAAQLSRESEKDKGRAPKLSDLGDSGMIERDADLVAMLFRAKNEGDSASFQLLVQKHRDGPCGIVNLTFLKSFTRFESQSHVDTSDYRTTHPD